jgi:hypothetical protein
MKISQTRVAKVIALLLTFLLTQIFLGLTFAAPGATNKRIDVPPPQAAAVLTTQGNKPIMVNGATAASGATILTGSVIETPDGVSATITIPGQGSLMLPGNTKLSVAFDNAGHVGVMLEQGCAVLNTKKGTRGEMDNPQGVIGKTDGTQDSFIDTCQNKIIPAVATGGGGLSTGAKVAIAAAVIGGGGAALAFGLRGSNPSRSTPR